MEAPSKIWIYMRRFLPYALWDQFSDNDIPYIRADLVEKLKGYDIKHKPDCNIVQYSLVATEYGLDKPDCTCGLTELLKEME